MKKFLIRFLAITIIGSLVGHTAFSGFVLYKCLIDGNVRTHCPARGFYEDENVPIIKNAKCCNVVYFRKNDVTNKYYYKTVQKIISFITSQLYITDSLIFKGDIFEPILPALLYSHFTPPLVYSHQPIFIQDCTFLI